MPLTILYFAAVRDLVGIADERVELPDNVTTVAELRDWLPSHRPALRGQLARVRFALDERFAADDARLHASATVALIPPVAGG